MNKTLINTISNYFTTQPIDMAWIFGSYARAEEHQESDIDILVNFSPNTKMTLFRYVHIVNDLKALTNKNIDLVEDGQLKPFAKGSAENDKILIYEREAKR